MITAAPSLSTLRTAPSTTRLGERRLQRRDTRSMPGTGRGAGPAGGRARSAFAAKPFLHRERTLMFVPGPRLAPARASSPPPSAQSRTSRGVRLWPGLTSGRALSLVLFGVATQRADEVLQAVLELVGRGAGDERVAQRHEVGSGGGIEPVEGPVPGFRIGGRGLQV